MSLDLSRRDALKTIAGAAAAALLPTPNLHAAPAASPQAFRFVHLTDIHIQHERGGDKGFAKALQAVEALKPKPDFILTGGDLVFDALEVPTQRARLLFDLYKKVIADNTSLPVRNTIGNHDVLGWDKKSGVSPQAAEYGKALVREMLELKDTFHTFEHKGWRFFCFDNIRPGTGADSIYQGGLGPEQFDWFKGELAKCDSKTPIVTCEHIPMLTVTAFAHEGMHDKDHWRFADALVCGDAAQRLPLLRTRNVRLCLSGHIHERDRIDYWGTTFINDGAVCGNWWRGVYRGVPEGFGVIDVRADGSLDHRYHEYGWKPQP